VAVQQIVDREQSHWTPYSGFQLSLDLTNYQNTASTCAIKKRSERITFLLRSHVLAVATTALLSLTVAYDFSSQKTVTQTTRPAH